MPWFSVETEYIWRGQFMRNRRRIEAVDRESARQAVLMILSRRLCGAQVQQIDVTAMRTAPTVETATQLKLKLDN